MPMIPGLFSVGLIDLCSTYSATPITAAELREISGASRDDVQPQEPKTRRPWNRLSDADRATVAARYEVGETSTALATDYGVAKSTIISILRAKRIVVRRQPLTAEQVSEAAQLYESGLSLSQVAEWLKVNQETMRVAILDSGVTLRPSAGGEVARKRR